MRALVATVIRSSATAPATPTFLEPEPELAIAAKVLVPSPCGDMVALTVTAPLAVVGAASSGGIVDRDEVDRHNGGDADRRLIDPGPAVPLGSTNVARRLSYVSRTAGTTPTTTAE